ncbi:VC0807 family protein [Williamsia maris]|uniref:UDP:flavonoid glycosyltransferase YjiC, YdhE family n=1 Tax=Williamsia maris TaxID=72806 RepID=A0ABT1HJB8_9NOCA|nr:glycosyltransferase [Williamsia maris]MCP2178037.1 UDP:flavonoid glycosyltransferase YjiC, YdhE family [Williamsia maris]
MTPLPTHDVAPPPERPWPMLIDVAAQVVCYFVAKYAFGASPEIALSVGAGVVASRIAVRTARRRRTELVELLILGMILVSIVAAVVAGQPRVVLVIQSCAGVVLCGVLVAGALTGRPVAARLLSQFLIRGDSARAGRWDERVHHRAAGSEWRRLELIWVMTAIVSTTASLAVAAMSPLDAAVIFCQAIPFAAAAAGVVATWVSTRELRRHLHASAATPTDLGGRRSGVARSICILALGSRGDVQPTIALALALMERGHRVKIAAMGTGLVALVRSAGVEAHPLSDTVPDHDDSYRRVLDRPIKRMRAYGRFLDAHVDTMSREIIDACADAEVIVAHSDGLDFAVSSAQGRVVVGYRFFPGTTNGAYSVTQYTSTGWVKAVLDRSPRWVKRLTWTWGDFTTWYHVKGAVNQHRAALGLAPYRSRRERNRACAHVQDLQLYDAALTSALAPEFGSAKPMLGFLEVPSHAWTRATGVPEVPPLLDEWLDAGEPPIYWGFGSMRVEDPDRLAADFADVCRERGQRGLIVVGWSDLNDHSYGDHIKVVESVNHSAVLPRCRAAVHHGGAGTTAAALRAGLPSLICPVLADQPFWGTRVTELGVGMCIPIKKLDARRLHTGFDFLLGPDATLRAQRLSVLIALGAIPAQRAARLVDMAILGDTSTRPHVAGAVPTTAVAMDFSAAEPRPDSAALQFPDPVLADK